MYKFLDAVVVDSNDIRETSGGYLVTTARVARTGIQEYSAAEFPNQTFTEDKKIIRVYRPADQVFSDESLASYAFKPVTDDHPVEPVNATNWRQKAVGFVGGDIEQDKKFVRVPLTLMDAGVIAKVKSGKRELSMGYESNVEFIDGETPDGEKFDAVMSDLRMNHLAIVDRGRAGSSVRIGDGWTDIKLPNQPEPPGTPKTMKLKEILVDCLSVEVTDAAEKAITKLQKDNADLASKVETAEQKAADDVKAAEDKAAADIAGKDTELAAKDTEIKELKDKQLSDAELDAKVEQRSALITKAAQVAKDADFAGKSDLEIKTIAVQAAQGDDFTKDKSPAYIDAAFDLIKAEKSDPVRDALKGGQRKPANDVDDNDQSAYEQQTNTVGNRLGTVPYARWCGREGSKTPSYPSYIISVAFFH